MHATLFALTVLQSLQAVCSCCQVDGCAEECAWRVKVAYFLGKGGQCGVIGTLLRQVQFGACTFLCRMTGFPQIASTDVYRQIAMKVGICSKQATICTGPQVSGPLFAGNSKWLAHACGLQRAALQGSLLL